MIVSKVFCDGRTNEAGQLTPSNALPPNKTVTIHIEEDVRPDKPFETREKVAEWVGSCVLGDLRTLQLGIVVRFCTQSPYNLPSQFGGGNFLLAAGCCMAIEYFGNVFGVGDTGKDRARNWVSEFLRPIDERYVTFFDLIWTSFRNGIVHGSWPQSLVVKDDKTDGVVVGVSVSPSGPHFAPEPGVTRPSFILNAESLLRDLHRAFEPAFREWILDPKNDGVRERASAPLAEVKPGNKELGRQLDIVRGWGLR